MSEPATVREIARDLTVALIEKQGVTTNVSGDGYYAGIAAEVGKMYTIIFQAVSNATGRRS